MLGPDCVDRQIQTGCSCQRLFRTPLNKGCQKQKTYVISFMPQKTDYVIRFMFLGGIFFKWRHVCLIFTLQLECKMLKVYCNFLKCPWFCCRVPVTLVFYLSFCYSQNYFVFDCNMLYGKPQCIFYWVNLCKSYRNVSIFNNLFCITNSYEDE